LKIGRLSTLLGIAVYDRAIACAEVALSGDQRILRRGATFVLPEGMTLEDPAAVGESLGVFLKQKGFSASRAIVGVPAKWLIAVEREVPPSDEDQGRAMLRLQAERVAVAESGEVLFDYTGRFDLVKPTKVLLVGMLRQRLQRVEQMVQAAGRSLAAVTSSGLTMAAGMTESRDGGLLMIGRAGAEMVWRDNGGARMLRHVAFTMNGHGTPPIAPLGAELRRAVAMLQLPSSSDLLLLDGVGLEDAKVEELSQRLGVKIDSRDPLSAIGVRSDVNGAVDSDEVKVAALAPATSLALAGARPGALPLDFLHSRLAPIPKQRISRRAGWAIALGATAAVALTVMLVSIHQRESQAADLKKQLTDKSEDIKRARDTVDNLRYARGFFVSRTPVLDCMLELTHAFRDDERIWARNFSLRENGIGTLSGRASDQKTVLAMLGRLQKNEHFRDAKLLDSRESDSRSRDVTYSISFVYKPE
jgi:hypothetical protein